MECLPGKEGLCHISELADFRVNKTEDICKLGDEIIVKCIGIDDKGRVKLSRRSAMEEAAAKEADEPASKAEAPADESNEAEAPADESNEAEAPAEESGEAETEERENS